MSIRLDIEIGIYIIENIYDVSEYDIVDAYSVILDFVPANYQISREAYIFGY